MPTYQPDNDPEYIRRLSATINIEASAEKVWTLLTDIDLMPGLHPQMLSAVWLDNAAGAAMGVRFKSENVNEDVGVYTSTSRIVEFRPLRAIAWTVEAEVVPPTVCRFVIDEAKEQTIVRQIYVHDLRAGATPPVSYALGYSVDS